MCFVEVAPLPQEQMQGDYLQKVYRQQCSLVINKNKGRGGGRMEKCPPLVCSQINSRFNTWCYELRVVWGHLHLELWEYYP